MEHIVIPIQGKYYKDKMDNCVYKIVRIDHLRIRKGMVSQEDIITMKLVQSSTVLTKEVPQLKKHSPQSVSFGFLDAIITFP